MHNADPDHFRRIQARLDSYPLVLYEGWKADSATGREPLLLDLSMDVSVVADRILRRILGFEFVGQWSGAVDYSGLHSSMRT